MSQSPKPDEEKCGTCGLYKVPPAWMATGEICGCAPVASTEATKEECPACSHPSHQGTCGVFFEPLDHPGPRTFCVCRVLMTVEIPISEVPAPAKVESGGKLLLGEAGYHQVSHNVLPQPSSCPNCGRTSAVVKMLACPFCMPSLSVTTEESLSPNGARVDGLYTDYVPVGVVYIRQSELQMFQTFTVKFSDLDERVQQIINRYAKCLSDHGWEK